MRAQSFRYRGVSAECGRQGKRSSPAIIGHASTRPLRRPRLIFAIFQRYSQKQVVMQLLPIARRYGPLLVPAHSSFCPSVAQAGPRAPLLPHNGHSVPLRFYRSATHALGHRIDPWHRLPELPATVNYRYLPIVQMMSERCGLLVACATDESLGQRGKEDCAAASMTPSWNHWYLDATLQYHMV